MRQVHYVGQVDDQKIEFGPIKTLIFVKQNFNYMLGVNVLFFFKNEITRTTYSCY